MRYKGKYFKQINNFPDYYISKDGEVLSLKVGRKIIKQHISTPCYPVVRIMNKLGLQKSISIHRTLALTFMSNPFNKPEVCHLNGNKLDYSLKNLKWVTMSENQKHSFAIGLNVSPQKGKFGSDHNRARKVKQLDIKTGKLIKIWDSIIEARRFYGITNIGMCCRGLIKSSGKFNWEYL